MLPSVRLLARPPCPLPDSKFYQRTKYVALPNFENFVSLLESTAYVFTA
jgi:hypothetical protein